MACDGVSEDLLHRDKQGSSLRMACRHTGRKHPEIREIPDGTGGGSIFPGKRQEREKTDRRRGEIPQDLDRFFKERSHSCSNGQKHPLHGFHGGNR